MEPGVKLEVGFTDQMQVPMTEGLTFKWQTKDRWWRKIVMNGFEEIDIRYCFQPKRAIERRMCEGMKHAVAIKTPDPMYPQSASQNKLTEDTTVAMTILSDGSVADIQLVGRAAQRMDEAPLATLRGWKFEPAMWKRTGCL